MVHAEAFYNLPRIEEIRKRFFSLSGDLQEKPEIALIAEKRIKKNGQRLNERRSIESILAINAESISWPQMLKKQTVAERPSLEFITTLCPVESGDLPAIAVESSFWSVLQWVGEEPDIFSSYMALRLLCDQRGCTVSSNQSFLYQEWQSILNFILSLQDEASGGFYLNSSQKKDKRKPSLMVTRFAIGAIKQIHDIFSRSKVSVEILRNSKEHLLQAYKFLSNCCLKKGGFKDNPTLPEKILSTNVTTAGIKLFKDLCKFLNKINSTEKAVNLEAHYNFLLNSFDDKKGGFLVYNTPESEACLCTSYFSLKTLTNNLSSTIIKSNKDKLMSFILSCQREIGFASTPKVSLPKHQEGIIFSAFATELMFALKDSNKEIEKLLLFSVADHFNRCKFGRGLFAMGDINEAHSPMLYTTFTALKSISLLSKEGIQVEYDPIETFWYIKNVFYAGGGFYGVIPSPCSLTTTYFSPRGVIPQLLPEFGIIPSGDKEGGSAGKEGQMDKKRKLFKETNLYGLLRKKEEIFATLREKQKRLTSNCEEGWNELAPLFTELRKILYEIRAESPLVPEFKKIIESDEIHCLMEEDEENFKKYEKTHDVEYLRNCSVIQEKIKKRLKERMLRQRRNLI